MANPNAIPLNLHTELGEAINGIIKSKTPYGSSTFIVKEFMENHKQELIEFWNGQGKNGEAVWNFWYKKWSMTRAEQNADKERKRQENIEKKRKQYLALSCSEEKALELAINFPDEKPLTVIKSISYAKQSELGLENRKEKNQKKQDEKDEAKRRKLIEEKKGLEECIKFDKDFNKPEKLKEDEERLKEINEKLGVEVD